MLQSESVFVVSVVLQTLFVSLSTEMWCCFKMADRLSLSFFFLLTLSLVTMTRFITGTKSPSIN